MAERNNDQIKQIIDEVAEEISDLVNDNTIQKIARENPWPDPTEDEA